MACMMEQNERREKGAGCVDEWVSRPTTPPDACAAAVNQFGRRVDRSAADGLFSASVHVILYGFLGVLRRIDQFVKNVVNHHFETASLRLFSMISTKAWIRVSYCAGEKQRGSDWSPSNMTHATPRELLFTFPLHCISGCSVPSASVEMLNPASIQIFEILARFFPLRLLTLRQPYISL
jgi:hypothetical protein